MILNITVMFYAHFVDILQIFSRFWVELRYYLKISTQVQRFIFCQRFTRFIIKYLNSSNLHWNIFCQRLVRVRFIFYALPRHSNRLLRGTFVLPRPSKRLSGGTFALPRPSNRLPRGTFALLRPSKHLPRALLCCWDPPLFACERNFRVAASDRTLNPCAAFTPRLPPALLGWIHYDIPRLKAFQGMRNPFGFG